MKYMCRAVMTSFIPAASFLGKIWLIFMILLRMLVIILAGYPIYQDEQERFVCNTLQPGCSNVCYDIFSPVSHFRFWLIQSLAVLLPYAVFSVYVLHKGSMHAAGRPCWAAGSVAGHDPSHPATGEGRALNIPDFSSSYIVHLLLRTLMEAAFGALHYLLFGFLVPKRFSCSHSPCTSMVDCYVSRPTEKSIMMLFIWGASALSFLLTVTDLLCSVRRRMARWRGPMQGAKSSPLRKEHDVPKTTPTRAEERVASPCPGRKPSQISEGGGWEAEGVSANPGRWMGEEGTRTYLNSPSEKSGVSGRMDFPDEDESEAVSSASDKLALAGADRPRRQASLAPRSEGHTKSEEPPSAPRGRLARPHSFSQLQPSHTLAHSGSASHLRAKKSEWV
ncbi:gap junction delta-4 protein [Choloepus didactylus]|uniref:gap junction delta-4 protein n=1 Tax=Choloepus didactylus TaxID=27675 RepID=UPI0018A010C1|nr:gap junction delta-4 protein [Choloepus didactylus]